MNPGTGTRGAKYKKGTKAKEKEVASPNY